MSEDEMSARVLSAYGLKPWDTGAAPMSSDELATWLREQIEQRKRLASIKALAGDEWRADVEEWAQGSGIVNQLGYGVAAAVGSYAAEHIAANDPQDTTARCEAELAILGEHAPEAVTPPTCRVCRASGESWARDEHPCRTVRLLGLGYRHRPGYKEEWRP